MPKTDQAQAGDGNGQSKDDLDSLFEKGWEQLQELTEKEVKAKQDAKAAKEVKATEAAEEDECPECDEAEKAKRREAKKKGETSTEKQPYKVLKVKDTKIPVYSREELVQKLLETVGDDEELVDLAQMRIDYRKKTQALGEDKRKAESEIQEKSDKLATEAEKMNRFLDLLIENKIINVPAGDETKIAGGDGDERAKIYEEFQIDPETALPHEKKLVEETLANRKKLEKLENMVQQDRAERMNQFFEKIIQEEREKYPYEDIFDDQGQNLTQAQFETIIMSKLKATKDAGKQTTRDDYEAWTREAVKMIHESQNKGQSQAPGITDDMDPEEFLEKFPGLSGKLREAIAAKAVEEAEAEKAKLPPTLNATRRGIDTTKRMPVKREGKSMDDILDDAFQDERIIKAFQGG